MPNRVDDLMGEVTNVQMYSPEIVTGYIMLFNVAEDSYSPLHQSTWAGLLKSRITRLSGRRPPSWSIGMIEASLFLEVDFSDGPRLVSGTSDAAPFFDRLVAAVRDRNPVVALADRSIHLAVTSPPYWTLKEYNEGEHQLGAVEDYEQFVAELGRVWSECHRVLVPGGRLVIIVGDVCLSRRQHGRHVVVPLHASIQESCRKLGFDNLAPIIWHKIANANFEMGSAGGFLGKPYEPNAVIKNDIEFILMQRKPGGYRSPSPAARALSVISATEHRKWFRQIWTIPGASTRDHPAPYPLELATRLVRMFSFVGDTLLDPFLGTGTTSVAAARTGRSSVGVEVDPEYLALARRRFLDETGGLFGRGRLEVGNQV